MWRDLLFGSHAPNRRRHSLLCAAERNLDGYAREAELVEQLLQLVVSCVRAVTYVLVQGDERGEVLRLSQGAAAGRCTELLCGVRFFC